MVSDTSEEKGIIWEVGRFLLDVGDRGELASVEDELSLFLPVLEILDVIWIPSTLTFALLSVNPDSNLVLIVIGNEDIRWELEDAWDGLGLHGGCWVRVRNLLQTLIVGKDSTHLPAQHASWWLRVTEKFVEDHSANTNHV